MRKKRVIGIIIIFAFLLFSIMSIRVFFILSKHNEKVDGSDDLGNHNESMVDESTTADILEEKKKSEDEYWEWIEDNAQNDAELVKDKGNIYDINDIDEITYGGVTYKIKEVGFIPERDLVSKLIPNYSDYNMMKAYLRDGYKLDQGIDEIPDYLLFYAVFELTNNTTNPIEYCVVNFGIYLTENNGQFFRGVDEPFYIEGNGDNMHTNKAYYVNLQSGESKTITLGLCIYLFDPRDYLEGTTYDTSDINLEYWIRLSTTSGGEMDGLKYIEDDKNHIYIKWNEGSTADLKAAYEDGD